MLSSTLLTASRQRRDRNVSQSEVAYQALKEKIVTLELPPASLLNEIELMSELNLGRTPIREALQRLAYESLVVILPRRGTIVADLNISDLQKLAELRLELEALSARLAALRATPEQVAEMEAALANADEIVRLGDCRQLIQFDVKAHRLLAQAAHNEFLAETLDRINTHVTRLWYITLCRVEELPIAVEDHRNIVDAVKNRDSERAAKIMRAHVNGFQEKIRQVL